MPKSPLRHALLAAALAVSAPGFAQNLLPNSEFDAGDGLASWQTSATGTWALGADAGTCPGSSSALGTSATAGGGSQYLSMLSEDCFAVDPVVTPALYLGSTYRTTANVWARLYLQFFSDGACASFLEYSGAVVGGTSPGFQRIIDSVAVPGVAASMRFWVDFNPQIVGVPQFTAEVDRVYLGGLAELFADGIEAEGGSVCRWSLAQGLAP